MIRHLMTVVAMVLGCAAPAHAEVEPAQVEGNVRYEVFSPSGNVETVDIEYWDGTRKLLLVDVPVPWQTTVAVDDPGSLSWYGGAEVRADWRKRIAGRAIWASGVWEPSVWVTVRVFVDGHLKCQNTLDVGNAACYGSTNFKS